MDSIVEWQERFPLLQIEASIAAFALYFVLRYLFSKIVSRRAVSNAFDPKRANYIKKVIKTIPALLLIATLGIIWEISLDGLTVYVASFLTIVGVGLFATWSIVSNITASVILFFFFPFKVGSKVKIVDGDNSAEGEVMGLSLFSITLKKEDGNIIYYPNNLAIQKSIIHLN